MGPIISFAVREKVSFRNVQDAFSYDPEGFAVISNLNGFCDSWK